MDESRANSKIPAAITAALILAMIVGTHLLLTAHREPGEGACVFEGPLVPAEAPTTVAGTPESPAAAAVAEPLPGSLQVADSWRLGFGMSRRGDPRLWAESLGAGWFLDWSVARRPRYMSPEQWHVVRVSSDCTRPTSSQAARLAMRYPGGTWVIGNEPDVIWQDSVTPERYAEAYHDFYQAIKASDKTASLAAGAVSQATPMRLEYLDRVLHTYELEYGEPMPVDVWTVHGFVLREQRDSWGVEIPPGIARDAGELREVSDHGRLDLFESQIREFRAWMRDHGYRDRPLALTEFGILMPPEYGFPPEDVAAYLRDTFQLLENMTDEETGYPEDGDRLVQRWAWFSLSDSLYPTSDLADLRGQRLTPIGWAYREFVETLATP